MVNQFTASTEACQSQAIHHPPCCSCCCHSCNSIQAVLKYERCILGSNSSLLLTLLLAGIGRPSRHTWAHGTIVLWLAMHRSTLCACVSMDSFFLPRCTPQADECIAAAAASHISCLFYFIHKDLSCKALLCAVTMLQAVLCRGVLLVGAA